MQTIVQDYGPIYGEAVNGTVQGRPNGSVYVPLSNKISLSITGSSFAGKYSDTWFAVSGSTIVAESQDLANYIQTQVYSDAACTTKIGERNQLAGQFNLSLVDFAKLITGETMPGSGVSAYFRVQLMSALGDPVATSDVIELTRP